MTKVILKKNKKLIFRNKHTHSILSKPWDRWGTKVKSYKN